MCDQYRSVLIAYDMFSSWMIPFERDAQVYRSAPRTNKKSNLQTHCMSLGPFAANEEEHYLRGANVPAESSVVRFEVGRHVPPRGGTINPPYSRGCEASLTILTRRDQPASCRTAGASNNARLVAGDLQTCVD